MLPNFIHAGVPKAASATLALFFRTHPEIYVPRPKELNFFSYNTNYRRGLAWYEAEYFPDTGDAKAAGDLSVGYSSGLALRVPERVLESLGHNVKFIFVFRDPAMRAYSNYCMARYKGQLERKEFESALDHALARADRFTDVDVARLQTGSYYSSRRDMDLYRYLVYLKTGHYHETLLRYVSLFGRRRVHVMLLEDIVDNVQREMDRLCDFLEVDRHPIDPSLRRNESQTLRHPVIKRAANLLYHSALFRRLYSQSISAASRKRLRRLLLSWNYEKNLKVPPMEPEVERRLREYYRPHNEALESFLGRELSGW